MLFKSNSIKSQLDIIAIKYQMNPKLRIADLTLMFLVCNVLRFHDLAFYCLSDMHCIFCISYWTKIRRKRFSSNKIFVTKQNFVNFVRFFPDFCTNILDEFSSDKIFVTRSNFHQFLPTTFCPIRYFLYLNAKAF